MDVFKGIILEQYGKIWIIKKDDGTIFYHVKGYKDLDFNEFIKIILNDENIEEIMYNGNKIEVFVYHHKYGMCSTGCFYNDLDINEFIDETASFNNKLINKQNPIFDGILSEGSRVNIILPPASMTASITIRKFRHSPLTVLDFIKDNTFSSKAAAFLWTSISRIGSPLNILFVGGTATGKTTALNAFSMFIEKHERVVLIEDTPELQLKQNNIVRMIANERKGLDMDALLKNALRMRPDRIIVGEVRGKEALTLFSAINTGHEGGLGTLHANSAKECVTRIINPPMSVPISMLSALNLVVVMKKRPEGQRYVQEISEVTGVDDKNVRFNKIFQWDPEKKECIPTGIPSRLKNKMAEDQGIKITEVDKIIDKRRGVLEDLVEKEATVDQLLYFVNNKNSG